LFLCLVCECFAPVKRLTGNIVSVKCVKWDGKLYSTQFCLNVQANHTIGSGRTFSRWVKHSLCRSIPALGESTCGSLTSVPRRSNADTCHSWNTWGSGIYGNTSTTQQL